MFARKPDTGTWGEWARFHLGWRVAAIFLPPMAVGESLACWAERQHTRLVDWAERA